MTNILLIPDPHAKPGTSNERASWMGKLIADIKPDVVVDGGDLVDMESLSSYDKGKASFYGRQYRADIEAGRDFDDRLWHPIRKLKKKLPRRIFLEGNHEHRIQRMLDYQHELVGTVGLDDLGLRDNYDDIVLYDGATPGIIEVEGVNFAHFFVSGVKGLPISGVNPARSLLQKQHVSSVSFHLHLVDWAVETTGHNRKIMGMFAGVGHDRREEFAGASANLWWPGVILLNNVEDGCYEPQFISMKTLEREYA